MDDNDRNVGGDIELDDDKIDDAALAILSLTLHDGCRVWKGLDWQITDRSHQKGWIDDPCSKAKSFWLIGEGRAHAQRKLAELFGIPEGDA